MTAAHAASELGISRATLYAYVSRGLIRTSGSPDEPRRRLYSAHDIEALKKERPLGGGRNRWRRPHWTGDCQCWNPQLPRSPKASCAIVAETP
ncbi:helix-turn-helix domain-containing protein [Agrobacterium tumefaciens]|uniref:helix-turn-helix domain-containing protein n=1 Tax=Agrobacterium tumefaciens TaxID=358 RepID=UPI001FCE1F42|nr:helix-turn-helix domain-containing protein [Agrobacterium tumefaciens]